MSLVILYGDISRGPETLELLLHPYVRMTLSSTGSWGRPEGPESSLGETAPHTGLRRESSRTSFGVVVHSPDRIYVPTLRILPYPSSSVKHR